MSENQYQYLFPYERVPAHSRIVIYGAGTLGQEYLRQMLLTNYCEVLAMADKNWREYPPMIVPIIPPDEIHGQTYDFVVVALRMAAAFSEVKRVLEKEGVPEDKIICVFERSGRQDSIFLGTKPGTSAGREERLACKKTAQSIAILLTGGFGDMVIQKRFVMELIRFAPDCVIDLYNIKAMDLLEHLYADCRNVNQVMPDLGSRFADNCHAYGLAMTIEACHFIKVNEWKESAFSGEFANRIRRLKGESDREDAAISTPAHLTMIRRMYQGLNAYSGFNYGGAFDIRDKRVSIPLDSQWRKIFAGLNLDRYITVNHGNGDCADGSKVAKSWDRGYFEAVIKEFKKRYRDIEVVQIGASGAEQLFGADRSILGKDFRLAVHILKNAIFHLDIEGGLVHLATQLGTKCVVLFGPTVEAYYGYEENINIRAGSCHNCWGLYSDVNYCARGLRKPECMSSITPGLVTEKIDEYMKNIGQREAIASWRAEKRY